ncbi:hypothetical protein L5G28_07725 [Gordonia sp. HY285]|uniref:hypothetical protein n=1 Tax=Gordonia liuliyuniae TaxID=2911517 RepID=UPI001F45EFF7|nr:hypothetical protein [Gordonia liuliyuniae]MCF8610050.1 hypothetical protein [Gordonia liuliyuniae]
MRAPDSNLPAYLPKKPSMLRRLRAPEGAQIAHFTADNPQDTSRRPRAITASAQVLASKKVKRDVRRPATQDWQQDAWKLRDEIGELRFIGDRQARACSQVRLFVGEKTAVDGEPEPVKDGRPAELSSALFSNHAAVEQSLKRAAQHIIFNGESIILVTEGQRGLEWATHSPQELTGSSGKWKLNDGMTPRDIDEDNERVIRAWTPHPEKGALADAPVRAVLPAARELRALTMYVSSQVDSRLAGAGLLLLPQGIESMHSQADSGDDADEEYTFADELTEYFIEPIKNRDSAAAVVPFMATVPPDLIDKIQHITFDSPLDAQAPALRDEAIRRIGLGMDSDPSVLLGQASSNHWSAWQIDENEVQYGVIPTVATICHALTVGLLQPLLESEDIADASKYVVWYDATPLQVRPDRSKDSQALYDKKAISLEVLRRENGFNDGDAPAADESERDRLWQLLQIRPDLSEQILPKLGIDLGTPGVAEGEAPAADAPAADTAVVLPGSEGVAAEAENGPPTNEGPQ